MAMEMVYTHRLHPDDWRRQFADTVQDMHISTLPLACHMCGYHYISDVSPMGRMTAVRMYGYEVLGQIVFQIQNDRVRRVTFYQPIAED